MRRLWPRGRVRLVCDTFTCTTCQALSTCGICVNGGKCNICKEAKNCSGKYTKQHICDSYLF